MNTSLSQLKQAAIANSLRQSELFADCPPAALQEIALFTSVKSLDAGSLLFDEHTAVSGFFIVQQGAIKLYRVTSWRREQVIHVFRAPESLAVETLVSTSDHLASARATESSQVLEVDKTGFLALLRRYPELSISLLRTLNTQVELLVGRVNDLTLKDVPTRLADWLLQRCPDPASRRPQTVHVPEAKRLLASELGTCSETLSRTLARFRDQHLLQIRGRAVTLLCPARLAQSIRFSPPPAAPA